MVWLAGPGWPRDTVPTTHTPPSPLTGCREIAPTLMYISEQEAEEHFPNGKAMLQGLHPRAKLQLDDTRSGQGRWDSSMSPLLLVLLLISPYGRLVQLPNTAKKALTHRSRWFFTGLVA